MWSVRERSIFQTRYAVQRPVMTSVPARRRYRFLTLGGFGGIALVDGARWSFRGKDAGSVRTWKVRARLRTRPRGEQRVLAAQPVFRQTSLVRRLGHRPCRSVRTRPRPAAREPRR